MIDLNFRVDGVEVAYPAATPQLCFKLRVDATEACRSIPIQALLLRVQIRIEPGRRGYPPGFDAGLCDLFGEPARWGATMRSMLWTHANVLVPSFTGDTVVDLPIECTYDFNVAATKYFAALADGDIPLCFLFSGTCFYETDRGLQAMQISWEREAAYRLPARTWKDMMARYYPQTVWLCLHNEAFKRLQEFKTRRALPNWERAIDELLSDSSETSPVLPVAP